MTGNRSRRAGFFRIRRSECGSHPGECARGKGECRSHLGECGSHPGECARGKGECRSHLGECGSHPGECGSHPGECGSHRGECARGKGECRRIPGLRSVRFGQRGVEVDLESVLWGGSRTNGPGWPKRGHQRWTRDVPGHFGRGECKQCDREFVVLPAPDARGVSDSSALRVGDHEGLTGWLRGVLSA